MWVEEGRMSCRAAGCCMACRPRTSNVRDESETKMFIQCAARHGRRQDSAMHKKHRTAPISTVVLHSRLHQMTRESRSTRKRRRESQSSYWVLHFCLSFLQRRARMQHQRCHGINDCNGMDARN